VGVEQNLSRSDRKRVDDILGRFQAGETSPTTLSSLLRDWKDLARSIAEGTKWSLSTYNRGLRTRSLIEEICEGLSMDGRRAVKEVLTQIDLDFISTTFDPLNNEIEIDPEQEIGWWQYRIPRSPQGEIELGFPELGMGIMPPSEACGELPL